MTDVIDEQKDFGFARVYGIELKYNKKPELDRDLLFAKIQAYTGQVEEPATGEKEDSKLAVWEANEAEQQEMLHFFHLNYQVQYSDGEVPAQTCLIELENRSADDYVTAIQQAWHWPEAGQVLEGCDYSLLLTDLMSSGLEPKARLQLLTGTLRAILETAPCEAIYFRESDKLVEPGAYLAAVEQGAILYGAMNIRFYNVEGTGSGRREGLMDSLGLAALGIPDVQCHFYDLEPGEVAGQLTDIAYYLYDQGDIVGDGETIGFTAEMRWRCEHQYALAAPHRVVLDIDPGEPYYAGRQGHAER
ncbi:DUF4261 domain-containing protein [Paenibacillus sp. GCM10012306]|uniref:DUF4261 domain-containing protein n=1 Tax=Paenibacillus sp. GCM10012306 TaxID=3317342 RepID=UPI003620AF11